MNMNSKLQRLREAIDGAIAGMTPEQFARRREGKWSAAEVLEHLNLTYSGTIKNLERHLRAGTTASADRRSKRWQRIVVIRLGYLPGGRKSPERVRPRGAATEQVVAEIFENIQWMDRVIADCELRFGKRASIADHPILGPLTAAEWRAFHLTHGKHHAKQIVRLRSRA
jgi:hypothetical protein